MPEPESPQKHGPSRTHGMRQIRAEGLRLHRQVLLPTERFLHNESVGGALLLVCAIVALGWANSPWSKWYFALRDTAVGLQIGTFDFTLDLQHWVNDGLMAVFFFVVALEIKRELIYGDLSEARKAALPVAAAAGGMILPAALYLAVNIGGTGAVGWGVPMATDIAFAVAILALLNRRVPSHLRVFLLAYAIVDDVGSILAIAIYYTAHFSVTAMGVAIATLGLILLMRAVGFRSTLAYLLPAVVFWVAMLESGVHATVAGVILGAITPATAVGRKSTCATTVATLLPDVRDSHDKEEIERGEVMLGRIGELVRETESPLARLERTIHPWVSYLILPVFALVNAGVALPGEFIRQALISSVTLGVLLGLIFGKAMGVFGFAWLAVRLGWAVLPRGVRWPHILGAATIGGVGFTVALFITGLAFTDPVLVEEAKIGVLAASLIAGLAGLLILLLVSRGETEREPGKDA